MAAAPVRASTSAGPTQVQLAQRLKTHQANIAHLERRTHATVRPCSGSRLPLAAGWLSTSRNETRGAFEGVIRIVSVR
jgi:hypothetical protein